MELYLDDAGSPYFNGELLEEFDIALKKTSICVFILPHFFADQSQEPPKKSLSAITNDIILEKFNEFNRNPLTWINSLESKCDRLEIAAERNYKILRLFLENSASEWYTRNHILLGIAT